MAKKCVECKKQNQTDKYKPFCSKRCADVDLYRWGNGGYAIPTNEPAPMQDLEDDEYN